MPETFGTGTAASSYDDRCTPQMFTIQQINPSTVGNASISVAGQLLVLTALDIVSRGGGTGGALFVSLVNAGSFFCVFNLGSNSDAFSWRGFLPLPNGFLGWTNSSDTAVILVASGLAFLAPE